MSIVINGFLRLLSDRILLKPINWDASNIIIAVRHGRTVRGVVMAVGPGHNPLKYKATDKGKRGKMDYSRHFRPTELQPGDVVELGGLNAYDGAGYQFTEVLLNNEQRVICQERDVTIVRDDMPKCPACAQSRLIYSLPADWNECHLCGYTVTTSGVVLTGIALRDAQ